MKKLWLMVLTATIGLVCLSACGMKNTQATETTEQNNTAIKTQEVVASPEWVTKLSQASKTKQLLIVAVVGDTTAYVSMHEKKGDSWKQILSTPGYIGKNGLVKTKEGDGKTPAGVFHFTEAFGIAANPGCAIPYTQVTEDHYWSGDENYQYNKMVRLSDYPKLNKEDSEHLIEVNPQYEYALNISYNEEGKAGRGSAIFLHCLGPQKPYTGGCVAIPREQMAIVMKKVQPECLVVINTLQEIAPDLYREWDL